MAPRFTLFILVAGTGCSGIDFVATFFENDVEVPAALEVPVLASAGADREVLRGYPTHLDGHATHHPQGLAFEVEWSQLSGEPVALSNRQILRPTFVAPLEEQELVFEIRATDGRFVTRDTIHLFVKRRPQRFAPRVRAGPDRYLDPAQRAEPEAADVLEGSADATLTWVALQPDRVSSPADGSFSPTIHVLTAERDGLHSAPDYLLLYRFDSERTGDRAPVAAIATVATSVAPGATIELDARTTADPNGDAVTYRWEQTAGRPLPALPDAPDFVIEAPRRQELLGLRVFARDALLESAPKQISIVVGAGSDSELPVVVGPDLRTHPEHTVVLDALGDTGQATPTATEFVWEQTLGKAVTLEFEDEGRFLSFLAPDEPTELAFAVFAATEVVDGPPSVSRVSVVSEDDNFPPLIYLSAAPSAPGAGATVFVSAIIGDPEGDALASCAWSTQVEPEGQVTLLPDPTCAPSLEGDVEVSFEAPPAGYKVTITLTAVDELGGESAAHLDITSAE